MTRRKELVSYMQGVFITSMVLCLVLKFIFNNTWFTSVGIPFVIFILLSVIAMFRFKDKEK
ncbi:hypothetical protein DFP96_11212 [Listeria rocourtiae]|uniref:Uncharacterized protein n=1 Tax=Listeria rocourtiae TaxID=647910 RepID=A0A4R6ZGX6_9LIST|nr:hypothetical protein PROCOU_08971 [Listeria rocourtiae FSL F6-920]TDR51527.1 hypothetical protein DFP96_11212 [Listeria rocourtiae]